MSTAAYTPVTWVNNTAPELAAGNLNHAELGIKAATDGVRALESVLVECEVYADNAQTSAIASAASASASEVSAISAAASAVTAKEEADRAVAVAGVDIATESVAGLIKASSEIVVGIDGAPTLKQTDTSGLVGAAGLSATLQSLINYIADAVKTKLVKISDLANNLTTTSSGLALDARQGKVLSDSLTQRMRVYGTNLSCASGNNLQLSAGAEACGLYTIKFVRDGIYRSVSAMFDGVAITQVGATVSGFSFFVNNGVPYMSNTSGLAIVRCTILIISPTV